MTNPPPHPVKRAKTKLPVILDAATRVFASKGYHGSTIAGASFGGMAGGPVWA